MKELLFGVFLITMGVFSQSWALPVDPPVKICYTQWFDCDDPSGAGDYETLEQLRAEYPGKICPKPLTIDAQTVSGTPASSTGQVFQYYDVVNGFTCVNSQQGRRRCLDYMVRFACRCPWPRG